MSKRILVVEDQEDNRQIIRDMLAGTDYEISEVENGEQALEDGPSVWTGRALQGENDDLEKVGLALLYPAH
jgi:response regulator RpfG family c-di-GMP phosphodiesterase